MTHLSFEQPDSPGFSLIEIILVLAISSFVIAIVLLAVPQAQKTRRDTQRKAYLELVAASLEKYKSSSAAGFQYPANPVDFQKFFDPSFGPSATYAVSGADPLTGSPYSFVISAPNLPSSPLPTGGLVPPSSSQPAQIYYYPGASCGLVASGNAPGLYSLSISLEVGGPYCIDNH